MTDEPPDLTLLARQSAAILELIAAMRKGAQAILGDVQHTNVLLDGETARFDRIDKQLDDVVPTLRQKLRATLSAELERMDERMRIRAEDVEVFRELAFGRKSHGPRSCKPRQPPGPNCGPSGAPPGTRGV